MGLLDFAKQKKGPSTAAGHRVVHLLDPTKNQALQYLHNAISTRKYNAVTFLPKFLYEQFSKYANLFFLFVSCIQQIKDVSPTNSGTTIVPLSIVIVFSGIKEYLEDSKRAKQDRELNTCWASVLFGTSFAKKQWKDIVVGDIVRVENSEYFPADLVLLSSSETEGLCYIETSNLDGETNLKIKQALPETAGITSSEQLQILQAGMIKSEQPNSSLYTYEGTITINGIEYPLNPSQLLLRGAQLRNTSWIYGVVVFTGHETKLLRNATATPIKSTKIDALVNQQIIFLFGILILISLLCSTGMFIRSMTGGFEQSILLLTPDAATAWKNFGLNILTYIILFNNLIPLSLIVTMELVKFILSALINQDLDMYHEASNTPAMSKTSSLIDELGQVDYIFSDKTGTLTCNIMEFRMCSIGGVAYADVVPDDKIEYIDSTGQKTSYESFDRLIHNLKEDGPSRVTIHEFLTLLAVCHTVIPETSQENPDEVIYQASSPDEAALVKGAKSLGYNFVTRRPRSVAINVDGVEQEYEILNICEFNSTRKRMSAIVRGPDGRIKLYTKGADTVIFERLSESNNEHYKKTCAHLEEYAAEGLRTLCIAYRVVSQDEYEGWNQRFQSAANTIQNRQAELDQCAEEIERDLILLGATAIEDKLQDGVPDAIHTLLEAGIKLWILTGDRQETAINIGYSCKLLDDEMRLLICNKDNHFETKSYFAETLRSIQGLLPPEELGHGDTEGSKSFLGFKSSKREDKTVSQYSLLPTSSADPKKTFLKRTKTRMMSKDVPRPSEPLALIIDGKSLGFALERDISFDFLKLATMCKAVICCRVSPLQKALVVQLVKNHVRGSVTLAIGDGANDVSMIQSAHVGVGISGMEGLQAARAADFAIAQFRFLRKLLLIHGGWAYSRLSKLILYSFYKNITMYLIQLWFALDNGFSGQTLFESWTQATYNVAFALFQPVAIGVFDCYVSAMMLDKYPKMYQLGQNSVFYNHSVFFSWFVNSIFHSLVIYSLMKLVYGEGTMLADGRVANNWLLGQMIYTTDLITITWKAALIADTWVRYTFLAIFGSIGLWFVLFPVYSVIGPMIGLSTELAGIVPPMFGNAAFWFGIVVVPIAAILRDFTWKAIRRFYFPKSYHIIQEMQHFNKVNPETSRQRLKKAVGKVRNLKRLEMHSSFAFSENESNGTGFKIITRVDTTKRKPSGL
ncbi:uncharacterized protein BJ171DRAFT_489619 [Polychytrium aggregatum]|uniref:uncharacterized protein n=1 Tax=Polychytrium aggregatum TaxID=110093 RepID=UPI0022FE9460|nr:uncharacterized protein BJ171DRAFT_489619 [Polychytrium aggregatum]KAI9208671.1 hypothetical protein BJ171DRAFT_489619 [Polychytrium aggregatum]